MDDVFERVLGRARTLLGNNFYHDFTVRLRAQSQNRAFKTHSLPLFLFQSLKRTSESRL
jgi:hypothetical protein